MTEFADPRRSTSPLPSGFFEVLDDFGEMSLEMAATSGVDQVALWGGTGRRGAIRGG